MRNSQVKQKIMRFFKCASLLAISCFTLSAYAQTKTQVKLDSLSGVVYDAVTKKPIEGAKVNTLSLKYSAITDETGSFKIKFAVDQNLLIISADDHNTREVPIFTGDKRKTIYLSPSSIDNYFGDEVTSLGAKRRTSTPNAQKTVDIDNLTSVTADADLQRMFGGDLRLTQHSGTTASGSSILLRGINSLNARTQPLIVVDGIVFDDQSDVSSIVLGNIINPLSNIDPNDIQNITVIKDGTSLYGSKGGNGVIFITTNRGKSIVTKITASAIINYAEKPKTIPMMNADQFRVYLTDLFKSPSLKNSLISNYYMNDDPKFVYYNTYHNNTDWTKGVYNNALSQTYNVAVNGGDDKALYNLSVGFSNGLSTLVANDYSRLNARFNSDINLTRNLSTAVDISYLQASRLLRNDGLAEYNNSVINSPGFLSLVKAPFLNPYKYSNSNNLTTDLDTYDFLGISNPDAIIEYGLGKSQQTNFNMSVKPVYTINKSLNVSSHFSYSYNNLSENLYSPVYGGAPSYFDYDLLHVNPLKNYAKSQFATQTSLFDDTRLNWVKDYGFHSLNVNAGLRYMQNAYDAEYAMGYNTGSDQIRELNKDLAYKSVGGIEEPYKLLTYYGVVDYSFKNRYFLQATATAETNSRFGVDAKSGFSLFGMGWACFPSLNASWLISSEQFMKSLTAVDVLKLRAGWGMSGNDGIMNAVARTYFSAVKYSSDAIGTQIYNIANSEIQWETVTKRNVGLDAGLFNNRLNLSLDLYSNITDNLLVQKSLPSITGVDSYWCNDGKLQNVGYEAAIDAKIVQTKDFTFSLGASVGHYDNKILALVDGKDHYTTSVYGGEIFTAVGQPMGQFYGYKTQGVYSTTAEAEAANLYTRLANGDLVKFAAGDVRFVNSHTDTQIYKDGKEIQVIDEKDKVVLGNSNPDIYGSFNANIKYKGLSVQCLFNYSYGNDVYNYLRSQLESGSTFFNQTMAMNNRWLTEGQVTQMPHSVYGDPMQNNRFSDRWIEDGSFLRLKTLQVSYELPFKIPYLQGLTVWASANNLWTLTKYTGMDPEFSINNQIRYQGVDAGLLPQSRSYSGGVKIFL